MTPAETQAYLAAAQLRVLEALERGPSTVDALAHVCDADKPHAYHLANVCAPLYGIDYSPGREAQNVTISETGRRVLAKMRAERAANGGAS